MDKQSNIELRVGIFVFIGLIIFTYIVFSIGDFYVFKPGYRIKARFGFIDGIQASAPIRYAGVEAGKVENIRIFYNEEKKKTEIELTGWISREIRVEKDSQAYVNTLGVVGEKYLELIPGTQEAGYLKDGDMIVGNDSVPMEKITQRAYQITEQLLVTLDSFKEVALNMKQGRGTIGKLLTDEVVYKNLEEFTADIKAHPWKLLVKGKEEKAVKDKKGK
jgi:phospholipid/cholesterol/gamma-HCH transport system substrate-binding protein